MTAKKKKTAKKKSSAKKSLADAVRVRMYRSGLGDCFLLSFPRKNAEPLHMLVDCGVFFQSPNEKQKMRDIASHIKTETKGTIDVLVATHEHYDHLIGFKHARDIFGPPVKIKEVWFSWTEKPGEPRAAWLRALEEKLKVGLQLALQDARAAFKGRTTRLENVLQFGGPLGADYSQQLGVIKRWLRDDVTPNVRYLEPHKDVVDLLPGVRVYPLGPPVKESLFRQMNDSKQDPETYRTPFAFSAVPAFLSEDMAAVSASDSASLAMPFEGRWQISADSARTWRIPPTAMEPNGKEGDAFFDKYYGFDKAGDNKWRRIDDDWLAEAETLALQLDSLTNNSSLALAIEVGNARRVILMAADAQVGNWLSWHEATWKTKSDTGSDVDVKAEDLLSRTVLYKVGHHGSHNATLKQKGLEMMTSDELVAMIPVDQNFANNTKHWEMPFPGLLTELTSKTKGRVIRADNGLPKEADLMPDVRQKFKAASDEDALYCDYFVPI
ncbi:MAG TPA: MBL fold metallo-hydrolase [Gemmatimonadaceae bacterium]|nr:MBL fold metallo-hydrolase [Gemmatimonadaceae bacterium]